MHLKLQHLLFKSLLIGVFILTGGTTAGWSAQREDPENLPMFVQPAVTRSALLKQQDEAFIRDAVLKYGNRQKGSDALAEQGWSELRSGNPSAALRRFNQAWLLNNKNYLAFWGFAAVSSDQGKLADAMKFLDLAANLLGAAPQRVALLTDIGRVHTEYAVRLPAERQLDRAQQFIVANNNFTESIQINPNFGPAWRAWAMSLYEQERYSEAWLRVKKARELGTQLPDDFLKKLSAKMPEPK